MPASAEGKLASQLEREEREGYNRGLPSRREERLQGPFQHWFWSSQPLDRAGHGDAHSNPGTKQAEAGGP